jgi:hypothetical protein
MGCCTSQDESASRKVKKRRRRTKADDEAQQPSAQTVQDRADFKEPKVGDVLEGRPQSIIQKPTGVNPFLVPRPDAPATGSLKEKGTPESMLWNRQTDMPQPMTTAQESAAADQTSLEKRLTSEALQHLCDDDDIEAFESVRRLSERDMDEEINSALAHPSPATEPPVEAQFDCLSIAELVSRAKTGALLIPARPQNNALHTKVKYKGLNRWMKELGATPAPVATVGGTPGGSRITAKVLEQNHLLLLKVQSRSSAGVAEDEPSEDDRRGSRASHNKVTDGHNERFQMCDFYEELDNEERRLSQLDAESSDDDDG